MFTTSAIRTCDTAPADAFAAAPPRRRRVACLPDDARSPGSIDRAQNRAEVVRILDAVEDDDERHRGIPSGHEIVQRRRLFVDQLGDQPLVQPPLASRSRSAVDTRRSATPARSAARTTSITRGARVLAHPHFTHAAGAKRFNDGIDAVNQHIMLTGS